LDLETLYLVKREEWRDWLFNNHDKKSEIWLIYPKKNTNKPRIEYNTAVEEALCFGWIDSTVKSLDQDHTIQRFTPRRPGSSYSQANKERVKWLIKKGMIHASVKPSTIEIVDEQYEFPKDIISKIKADGKAWDNFQHFSDSYKRLRIAYIESSRKRPSEFDKRLKNFIEKTRKNIIIKGFGGIDKYY
jgi:uncharacterized protein YdeI (YjbR/CyaY-like superfamily)